MRIRISGCRNDANTIYRILLKVVANARLHISAPGWTSERTLAGLILEVAQATRRCSRTCFDGSEQDRLQLESCQGVFVQAVALPRCFCPLFCGLISRLCGRFRPPLLEALGYAKPVLARDIPIFHTFAANGVHRFPADADHSTLARSIRAWVHEIRAGKIEIIASRSSWPESASALIGAVSREATP
jgi:hypothetical protein